MYNGEELLLGRLGMTGLKDNHQIGGFGKLPWTIREDLLLSVIRIIFITKGI